MQPGPPAAGAAVAQLPPEGVRSVLAGLLEAVSRSLGPLSVLVVGLVFGFVLGRLVRRVLLGLEMDDAVEGTAFERAARGLGTSTIDIVTTLITLFVYLVTVGITLELAALLDTRLFVSGVTTYLGELLVAAVIVIAGLIVADIAELAVSERLEAVKLQVGAVPRAVKYSVYYVTGLLVLAQLGVATSALLVLLGGYAFGVVVLSGLALWDLLRAGAAGVYLLLVQPYGIGDRVEVDGHRGIVQDVDVFITRVEADGEEFIVPNHRVFRSGVVRIRE